MNSSIQEKINDGVDQTKEQVKDLKSVSKTRVAEVAGEAKRMAKFQAEKQIDHLADQLSALSRALRTTNEKAINAGSKSGFFGDSLIDSVSKTAESLRFRDIDQIVTDTISYAKARPVPYIIGAVALGFVGARFIKNMNHHDGVSVAAAKSGAQ
jgi:hypothetical protein